MLRRIFSDHDVGKITKNSVPIEIQSKKKKKKTCTFAVESCSTQIKHNDNRASLKAKYTHTNLWLTTYIWLVWRTTWVKTQTCSCFSLMLCPPSSAAFTQPRPRNVNTELRRPVCIHGLGLGWRVCAYSPSSPTRSRRFIAYQGSLRTKEGGEEWWALAVGKTLERAVNLNHLWHLSVSHSACLTDMNPAACSLT